MASLGVIVIAILMFLFEFPRLSKQGLRKEKWTFAILLLGGTTLSLLLVNHITPPSPHKLIAFIYKPLSEVIDYFL